MRCSEAGAETLKIQEAQNANTQFGSGWQSVACNRLAHWPANIPVCLCNEYLPTSKHPEPGIFNLSHLNESKLQKLMSAVSQRLKGCLRVSLPL